MPSDRPRIYLSVVSLTGKDGSRIYRHSEVFHPPVRPRAYSKCHTELVKFLENFQFAQKGQRFYIGTTPDPFRPADATIMLRHDDAKALTICAEISYVGDQGATVHSDVCSNRPFSQETYILYSEMLQEFLERARTNAPDQKFVIEYKGEHGFDKDE